MSSKKHRNLPLPTNELKDEELLGLLNDNSSKELHEDVSVYINQGNIPELNSFITYFNIRMGKNAVNKRLIYYMYQNFIKQKVKYSSFTIAFSNFFPSKKNFYLLDLKSIKFNKQTINIINNVYRKDEYNFKLLMSLKSFVDTHNIKGTRKIEFDLFYVSYVRWREQMKKHVYSKYKVYNNLRKVLDCKRTVKNEMFVCVSDKFYNYLDSNRENYIKYMENYNEKKAGSYLQKSNKRSKEKVSS